MLMKRLLLTSTMLATAIAFTGGAAFAAPPPDIISLPDGFQPEGIVVGNGATVYAGSLADGDIFSADLRNGVGHVIIDGPGTPAVGLDFDRRTGYLFVAGGPAGDDARVYDVSTGDVVATHDFGGGFVNDVIVVRNAAYFTDSFAPVLYKLELGHGGEPTGASSTLALTGDFDFVSGAFNTNGIVATSNGKALIIVNSTTGHLYSVNPETGNATAIDLGGDDAMSGDGMVLVGRHLYVVQNFFNRVSEFLLAPDGLSASVVDTIVSPDFDIPTTADLHGQSLYAVNARFTTTPLPTTSYEIVRVDR